MATIPLTFGSQHVLITSDGGGIVAYWQDENGTRRDFIYGYDVRDKAGSMGDVLFPFPGRVEGARYAFKGQEYELTGIPLKGGNASHGFAKWEQWAVDSQSEDSAILTFAISATEYGPKGYPFSMSISVEYSLDDDGLRVYSRVRNTGDVDAPFGLGFHPYFNPCAPTPVDSLQLLVPAEELLEFDGAMKPTGRTLSVIAARMDFQEGMEVGARTLDHCFAGLQYEDGTAYSTLVGPLGKGVEIWQDNGFAYQQVFTADTLADPDRRAAVAIEPMTCSGYALNVPELGLRTLAPGEEFAASWGVRPLG